MMSDRSLSSFGFSEPKRNYFPVPNEWFEYVDNLPHGALFVLLYLMKHTWGHRQVKDVLHISLQEIRTGRRHRGKRLDSGTNLSLNTIRSALRLLVARGLVEEVPPRHPGSSKGYRIRLRETQEGEGELSASMESESEFQGFSPPTENYFKVPNDIFDLAYRYGLGFVDVLVLQYMFRHTWGYHNPDGVWMTADEIAHGRRFKQKDARYDHGIGKDLSGVYRALKKLRKLGLVVCRFGLQDEDASAPQHREYNLRLQGQPATADACLDNEASSEAARERQEDAGAAPEHPDVMEHPASQVNEEGLDAALGHSASGQIAPPVGQIAPPLGRIAPPSGRIAPPKARRHTFKDTSSDTFKQKPPADTGHRPVAAEAPAQETPAGAAAAIKGAFADFEKRLHAVGWIGATRDAQRLYEKDPALLDLLIQAAQQATDLENPAGWLRRAIRDAYKHPEDVKRHVLRKLARRGDYLASRARFLDSEFADFYA